MPTQTTDLELRIKAATEGLASVQTLADEIDALGGNSAELRAEASKLNADLQGLGRQQAVIENFNAVSEAADKAAAELAALQTKAADAGTLQTTLARNVETSSAALEAQQRSVTDLSASLQAAKTEVADATAKQAQLAVALKDSGTAQRALNSEVTAANSELTAAERALSSNESELKRAQTAVGTLEQRYEAARTAQRSLTDQVIAAENPTAALTARHEQATDKVSGLERALEVARGRVSELTTGLDQQRTAVGAAQEKYDTAATAAQSAASANAELGAQVAAAKQELSQAKVSLSDNAAALKGAEAAERSLQKAVADDEAALAKQASTVERLTAEVDQSKAAQRAHADALTQAGKAADYAGINTSDLATEQQRVTRETINAKSAAVELSDRLRDEKTALAGAKGAADQTASSSKKLGDEQKVAGEKAKEYNANFRTVITTLAALAGIQLGGQLVKDLVGLADEAKNVSARLKIAAGASDLYAQAQKDVLDISLQTGSKLESTANLYGRLALAIRATGGEQADATIATRAISEAFAVSGGSAESANAAIVQLAQGIASGTLRGEELNSVLEQAPRLALAFADSLGITTGELRTLGAAGALTPQLLLDALKEQAPKIAKEFEQIPVTVGRAVTNLGTALTVAVGNIDEATGSTSKLAETINELAKSLIEFSANNQDGFRATGDIIAAVATAIWAAFTAAAQGISAASGVLARGLAAVTSGETSERFASMAQAFEDRADELKISLGNSLGKVVADVNDVGEASTKTSAKTDEAADKIVGAGNKIDTTGKKFVDVAAGMAKAAAVLQTDVGLLTDGISNDAQQAADALGTLLTSGQLTADGLRVATQNAIDAGKTVQDLDLIRGAIEKAYADGKISVDDMHASVERVTAAQQKLEGAGGLVAEQLGESAKSLGLSYDAIANRASAAATTSIKAFADLAASGTVSIGGLQQSIDAVFAKLESKPDVEAFQASLKAAHDAGTLSAEAYNAALERSRTLLQQLQDAADPFAAAQKKALLELAAAYDARIQKEKDAATASRESAAEIQSEYDKLRQSIGGADTLEALKGLRQALNDAYQDGILGAEQYSALVDEINSKTVELQDGLRGVEGFAQEIGKYYDSLYADLRSMSDGAVAMFKGLELGQPFQKSLDQAAQLKQQIYDLGQEIQANQRYLLGWVTAGLGELMTKTAIHFDQVKQKFVEQQLAALRWQEQLSGTGAITDRMLDGAEQALRGFDLLDSQTLSGLRGAIDSARQKLDSLRESADSTLLSLKEELADAQGDLVSAQQLRNQQRIAELQSQLAQAQALGDQQSVQTLTQALAALKQINDINLQSARQQQQTQQQVTPKTPAASPSSAPTSAGAKKVEVTLHIGNTSVTGDFDDADAQALLDALARAQSVSTH